MTEFWSMETNLGTVAALIAGLLLGATLALLLKPSEKKR